MLNHLTRNKALLFCLFVMLLMLGHGVIEQAARLVSADLSNPDSYYKLVMVRDHDPALGFNFVARDNAPDGFWMHWSLPHTWMVWVFAKGLMTFGLEQQLALLVAGGSLTLLSMLLLALFVTLAVGNAGSPKAALLATLAVASSPSILGYGQLLQITHHIFMLVPVAAAAACFLRPAFRAMPWADFAGGLLLGLALWISPETMPLVVTMAGIRAAIRLQYPGAGTAWPVALGLMIMLVAGWCMDPPPPTFTAWALDHISLAWLLLGGLLALLLLHADLCVGRALGQSQAIRELTLAFLLAASCWLSLVPGALQGADSLITPYLHEVWYRHIQELQPLRWPFRGMVYLLIPIVGGVLLLAGAWRERSLWMLALALATLVYAVLMSGHVRMGAAGGVLAALAFGIGMSRLQAFENMHDKLLPVGRQVLATLLILVVPLQLVGILVLANLESSNKPGNDAEKACRLDTILPWLNALPRGIVLAVPDLGPEILFKTHHRVVAGNYHHNIAGLTDNFRMLRDVPPYAEARALAGQRGVNYVLVCTKHGGRERTLVQRAAAGKPVDWLSQCEIKEGWRICRGAVSKQSTSISLFDDVLTHSAYNQ